MIKNIFITENTNIHQAMQKLQKTGEKCLIVVSKQNKLLGTINERDIRRAILNRISTSKSIKNIYEKNCIYIENKKNEFNKLKKIMITKKVDFVVHLAAIVGESACKKNPKETEITNIEGTKKVIGSCLKNKATATQENPNGEMMLSALLLMVS